MHLAGQFGRPLTRDEALNGRHLDVSAGFAATAPAAAAMGPADSRPSSALFDRRAELTVEAGDQMSSLEHWDVVHRISEASPLYPIRNSLGRHLKAIDRQRETWNAVFAS